VFTMKIKSNIILASILCFCLPGLVTAQHLPVTNDDAIAYYKSKVKSINIIKQILFNTANDSVSIDIYNNNGKLEIHALRPQKPQGNNVTTVYYNSVQSYFINELQKKELQ